MYSVGLVTLLVPRFRNGLASRIRLDHLARQEVPISTVCPIGDKFVSLSLAANPLYGRRQMLIQYSLKNLTNSARITENDYWYLARYFPPRRYNPSHAPSLYIAALPPQE